jgi:hypothetical protein
MGKIGLEQAGGIKTHISCGRRRVRLIPIIPTGCMGVVYFCIGSMGRLHFHPAHARRGSRSDTYSGSLGQIAEAVLSIHGNLETLPGALAGDMDHLDAAAGV